MRIEHVALLSALSGAVSCAAGTGDVAALSGGGTSSDGDGGSLLAAENGGGTSSGGGSAVISGGNGGRPSGSAGTGGSASFAESPPLPGSFEVATTYVLDVACGNIPVINLCVVSEHADKDVTFTLPPGTKRSSIVYTVTPQGPSASGSVDFAGTSPLDGTVHLHGSADAFSSVHIEVRGVIVVPR